MKITVCRMFNKGKWDVWDFVMRKCQTQNYSFKRRCMWKREIERENKRQAED